MKILGLFRWIGLTALGLAWANALAGAAPGREQKAPVASPDAASVRVTRAYGWKPLTATRLVLWLGVEEPYLIDLAPGCPDLRTLRVQGVTAHNRRLTPRLDSLVTAAGPCVLAHLQRADRAALAAQGLSRDKAQPLLILPAAVPAKPK